MLNCPKCGEPTTLTTHGWDLRRGGGRRRIKECYACGYVFYTIESIERGNENAETTKAGKPAVRRATSRKERTRPFSVSELYIALRPRQGMAEVNGSAAAKGNSGAELVPWRDA